MNNERDNFVILKYKSDLETWQDLDNKLEMDPDEDDSYIYNKLPLNLDKNKKYDIIVFGFDFSNPDNYKIFIGKAEVFRKEKKLIKNTFKLNSEKKDEILDLYKESVGTNLSENNKDEFGKYQYIFLREINRSKFNEIINSDINYKPQIEPGDFQFCKYIKDDSITSYEKNLCELAQKDIHARRALACQV